MRRTFTRSLAGEISVLAGWLLISAGCQPQQPTDHTGTQPSPSPQSVLQHREKSSTQAVRDSIILYAQQIARTVGQHLQAEVVRALRTGPEHAIRYCNLQASPIIDSLSQRWGVRVRRLTHKPRNPANEAQGHARQILQNFLEAVEAGKNPAPVAAHHDSLQGWYVYLPIRIPSPFCLTCHGVPGRDIPQPIQAALAKYYPEDRATGFRVKDLRGMWEIWIPDTVARAFSAPKPS